MTGTIDEDMKRIEEEIQKTPYNKATQRHIGLLKAKLARLRDEKIKRRKIGAAQSEGFGVKKSGHATVALVGYPSVGKSTLLNLIAGTESKVAAYDFTTLDAIPGLLTYRGAEIQFVDLPGIIEGASKGKGRGWEPLSMARSADLLLVMCDIYRSKFEGLLSELYAAGIRVNRSPPDIRIKKTSRGGVTVNSTVKLTKLDKGTITAILSEFKIVNAFVVFREDADSERLVDAILMNRVYAPAICILNKVDMAEKGQVDEILHEARSRGFSPIPISASTGEGVEGLKAKVFESLRLIRIYLKKPGADADTSEPLVVHTGASVGDICNTIHGTWRRRFRYAYVWGKSAKFPGQTVGLEHKLCDQDILTIFVQRVSKDEST